MFLPFELVEIDRHQATNAFYNNEEARSVHWKFLRQDMIETPTQKDYQTQNSFKVWLKAQDVITVINFKKYINWLQRISANFNFITIADSDENVILEQIEFHQVYKRVELTPKNIIFNSFIGRKRENGVFNILFIYEIENDEVSSVEEYNNDREEYNEENSVVQQIINNTMVVAYDTSIDCESMASV